METRSIRWGAAVGGVVLAEIVLIAAAVAWVAIYSYVIRPGEPVAVYRAYAMQSGPWVSILAGMPLFFALGRWLARNVATALAIGVGYILVDSAILVASASPDTALSGWIVAASYVSKIAAVYLGARSRGAGAVSDA